MEMREIFATTLVDLAKRDERIVVLDADLNTSTRTDMFRKEFPSRFIQCGIAEQNMFGWAAGLAVSGLIPFPTTFATFAVTRALDQINISIAYARLNVKIAGSYCGISTGKAGATHQTIQDLAIMRAMPNMRVLDAADGVELTGMIKSAVEYDGPVYFRVLRPDVPKVFGEDYRFSWAPVLLREGGDILLIGAGLMTHRCLEAARMLEEKRIHAAVLHVPCLKPLEPGLLLKQAEKAALVVTAENHSVIGGLGSAVAEILGERMPVKMRRVGVKDVFVETGDDDDIYKKYGLTSGDIVTAALDGLNNIF